jgi:PII-like signaling protein
MQIYIGGDDRWKNKPLHQAIVEAMRANDIAGVTVYRSILGYGAHRRAHKTHPLQLSHDESIMLSVIDTEEKLQSFLPLVEQIHLLIPHLDAMVEEGLIAVSRVDVIRYSKDPATTP